MEILDLRKSTKLSQVKFCKKFDIPLSTYCHWEQGIRIPPKYVISMIKTILILEGFDIDVQECNSDVMSE